jgi:stage III sporulation protein SpoIIIAA
VAQREVVDNLERLLEILPPQIQRALLGIPHREQLIEIVFDLGRPPEARFFDRYLVLSPTPTSQEDIKFICNHLGSFGADNRAGIERTLHRISALRNRRGEIIGLTCRVGRAVFGTIEIIRDVVETGQSILFLGKPGVGKTTMLREVARVLADEFSKRVMIVDTSNEIAGDGDIPHPAIGRARRLQVATPEMQAQVMIEAVENHMPEVIVIDEIGNEREATAARTIAERGVQLVGTAHGTTLENLVANPVLSDLVGGIQTVTLGDEEARKRGSQKTVLERKAPPCFDVVVELRERNLLIVHRDTALAVDRLLRGAMAQPEIRTRDRHGQIQVLPAQEPPSPPPRKVQRIFPYAISQNRLEKAIANSGASVEVTKHLHNADLVLTIRGQYRKMPKRLKEAEQQGLPIEVLRSNTITQMEEFLGRFVH